MTVDQFREILRRDVVEGAKALLGATLVRGGLTARIVETEAYRSDDDPASHCFRGRTPRNWPMYLDAGFSYIYFNYGVHWMLNVSAHEEGDGSGILIRAAQPLSGLEEMRERRGTELDRNLLSGPGKLAKAFSLDGSYNGLDLLCPSDLSQIHLVPPAEPAEYTATERIGLAIGKGHDYPWRFVDAARSEWASR
jgi:DNA-3-methyladenine glycosylase